jgi:hypothetical protein
MPMFLLLRRIVGLTLACTLYAASAGSNFSPVNLPHGVYIELPNNWTALSDSKRTTLAAFTQAQVERLKSKEPEVELPFAASLYDDDGLVSATMNIRYYPALLLSQKDASRFTSQDVLELDESLKRTVIPGAESMGQRVLAWRGTNKLNINGLTAFVSEYRVSAVKGGPFVVRLVRVFKMEDSFTLSLSFREDNLLLEPIVARVIQTMRAR